MAGSIDAASVSARLPSPPLLMMLDVSAPGSSWADSLAAGPDPSRLEASVLPLESLLDPSPEQLLAVALAVSCCASWLTSTCSNSSAVA